MKLTDNTSHKEHTMPTMRFGFEDLNDRAPRLEVELAAQVQYRRETQHALSLKTKSLRALLPHIQLVLAEYAEGYGIELPLFNLIYIRNPVGSTGELLPGLEFDNKKALPPELADFVLLMENAALITLVDMSHAGVTTNLAKLGKALSAETITVVHVWGMRTNTRRQRLELRYKFEPRQNKEKPGRSSLISILGI